MSAKSTRKNAVRFQWQHGDMVSLDNMLVAHARDPYVGPRKIVVALGDMVDGTATRSGSPGFTHKKISVHVELEIEGCFVQMKSDSQYGTKMAPGASDRERGTGLRVSCHLCATAVVVSRSTASRTIRFVQRRLVDSDKRRAECRRRSNDSLNEIVRASRDPAHDVFAVEGRRAGPAYATLPPVLAAVVDLNDLMRTRAGEARRKADYRGGASSPSI